MLQDLQYGLLDESINHGGNTQVSFIPISFRYAHSPYRLGMVDTCLQLMLEGGPMVFQVAGKLFDRHTVDSRRTFIAYHLLQRAPQIFPLQDACHQ
jgi:hypothetical protein